MLRFAAIGIDHGHIFDHIKHLSARVLRFRRILSANKCAGRSGEPDATYPDAPQVDREQLFDDPSIDVICTPQFQATALVSLFVP